LLSDPDTVELPVLTEQRERTHVRLPHFR
jgi:hypothetical protein